MALGALGPSGPSTAKFVPSARSSATSIMASLRRPAILRRESAVERPGFLPERLVFRRGVQNLFRGRLQARPANVWRDAPLTNLLLDLEPRTGSMIRLNDSRISAVTVCTAEYAPRSEEAFGPTPPCPVTILTFHTLLNKDRWRRCLPCRRAGSLWGHRHDIKGWGLGGRLFTIIVKPSIKSPGDFTHAHASPSHAHRAWCARRADKPEPGPATNVVFGGCPLFLLSAMRPCWRHPLAPLEWRR